MSNTINIKKYRSTITSQTTESPLRSTYSNNKGGKSFSTQSLRNDTCFGEPNRIENQLRNVKLDKRLQSPRSDADSIGSTVGLTCSTLPIVRRCDCLEEEMHSRTLAQDFSRYLKAFALIYVLPEKDWTAENIDSLMSEGENMFNISSEMEELEQQPVFNNYNSIEQCVKRNFKVEGHRFTLELKPPYLGDNRKAAEKQPPHIMRNLRPVLQGFFRKAHYCLLLYKPGYLLIWRRHSVFFIMDLRGRRQTDLVSDRNGTAMLLCLRTIDNVVHLVNTLSGLKPEDKFLLRELSVECLVTPDGQVFMRETTERPPNFRVVNENYAYLKSNLHLSLNPDVTLHSCSGIVVCVAAILASKVDHPASWNVHIFDHLICYGVELCRTCWGDKIPKRQAIDLDTFPTQLRLGQFVIELKLSPRISSGVWRCGICHQNNDFEHELRNVIKSTGNALFQINNQMYALWFKDNFYYLLDPYRHKLVGPEAREDSDTSAKWATVRMFRDVLSMLNVFHQLLRESNPQSPFFIHAVHIRNMAECPLGYSLKPVTSSAECDVKSLNESIRFPEELSHCSKDLEPVSDYEPDMKSILEDPIRPLAMDKKGNLSENDVFSDVLNNSDTLSSSLRKYKTPALASLKFPHSVTELSFRSVISKDQQSDSKRINTKDNSRQEKNFIRISNKVNSRQSSPNYWRPPLPPNKLTNLSSKNTQRPTTKPPFINIIRPVTTESSAKPLAKSISPSAQAPKKLNDAGMDSLRKVYQPAKLTLPTVGLSSASDQSISKRVKSTNLTNDEIPSLQMKVSEPKCHLFANIFNIPIKDQDNSQKIRKLLTSPKRSGSCPASRKQSEFRLVGGKLAANSDRTDEPKPNQEKQETKCDPTQLSKEIQPKIQSSFRSAMGTTEEASEIIYDPLPYPVYLKKPQQIAVVGSESGTMESLDRLLNTAFEVSNRALTLTPWGSYVVFKQPVCKARNLYTYFLFDGCTCNIDRFRHLDLSSGTAGLQSFCTQAEVVCYMIDARETRSSQLLQTHLETTCRLDVELLGRCA